MYKRQEDFSGILVGDFKVSGTKPEIRTGQTPEMERDFYIRIRTADGTVTEYGYCLGELEARFADWKTQEIIEYFNHNMDQGKGGIRKVTARGWLLTDLLLGCLLYTSSFLCSCVWQPWWWEPFWCTFRLIAA